MKIWCSDRVDQNNLCEALNKLEAKGFKIKEIIPINYHNNTQFNYHNNTQYSYLSVYKYEIVYTIEDSTEE